MASKSYVMQCILNVQSEYTAWHAKNDDDDDDKSLYWAMYNSGAILYVRVCVYDCVYTTCQKCIKNELFIH